MRVTLFSKVSRTMSRISRRKGYSYPDGGHKPYVVIIRMGYGYGFVICCHFDGFTTTAMGDTHVGPI